MKQYDDPAALAAALDETDYIADEGLATAAFLALRMGRPLFLEGDAGVGKTALAQALATVLDAKLIRLQCYEGIDASQALYDWDFARQMLHLRAAEADETADLDRGLHARHSADSRHPRATAARSGQGVAGSRCGDSGLERRDAAR